MQVATLDSVVLYDTQSVLPLAVLGHLHYDSITDLAWSSDSQYLAVSSRDCYCRWGCRRRGGGRGGVAAARHLWGKRLRLRGCKRLRG